jgi:hypothetical protein
LKGLRKGNNLTEGLKNSNFNKNLLWKVLLKKITIMNNSFHENFQFGLKSW